MSKLYKKDLVRLRKRFLDKAYTSRSARRRQMYREMADCVKLDEKPAYVLKTRIVTPRKASRIEEMRDRPEYEKAVKAYEEYLAEVKKVEAQQEAQVREQEEIRDLLASECLAIGMIEGRDVFVMRAPKSHGVLIYDSTLPRRT